MFDWRNPFKSLAQVALQQNGEERDRNMEVEFTYCTKE